MNEYEMSFVFTRKSFAKFLQDKNLTPKYITGITDEYLSPDCRVRTERRANGEVSKCVVTNKIGNKSTGVRQEEEAYLSPSAANILSSRSRLTVKKSRWLIHEGDRFLVIADYIDSPMDLVILEIESLEQEVPEDITDRLFGINLTRCPLSSWNLFKRKIAFCGGPSSGKTESAKLLSHLLNTQYNANSFHVTEYATSFIQKYNRHPTFDDQIYIFYGQRDRENNAGRHDIVVSDCPTFLAFIYAQIALKNKIDESAAMKLSKIYKRSLFDVTTYTDIIFLQIDTYKDNNVRFQSREEAVNIENQIKDFLDKHAISYHTATYNNVHSLINDLFYIN